MDSENFKNLPIYDILLHIAEYDLRFVTLSEFSKDLEARLILSLEIKHHGFSLVQHALQNVFIEFVYRRESVFLDEKVDLFITEPFLLLPHHRPLIVLLEEDQAVFLATIKGLFYLFVGRILESDPLNSLGLVLNHWIEESEFFSGKKGEENFISFFQPFGLLD